MTTKSWHQNLLKIKTKLVKGNYINTTKTKSAMYFRNHVDNNYEVDPVFWVQQKKK